MARTKYYNPTTQQWEYADRNPLPTGQNGDILVNENGVWVARQPSRLPAGYQEVDYIESDGSGQYINTGFIPSEDCKAIFDIAADLPITSSGVYLGGSRENSSSKMFYFMVQNVSSKAQLAIKIGGNNNTPFAGKQITNKSLSSSKVVLPKSRVLFGFRGGDYCFSEILGAEKSDSITAFTTTYPVFLFGINNGGVLSQPSGNIRVYEFSAFTGLNNVIKLIPCYRKSDSEIGMYDIVNNQFFTNAGTGAFLKGADI